MRKIILDIVMLGLMLLVMGFQYVPKSAHEVLGIALLLAALAHLWLNSGFIRTLLRGRWPAKRIVSTALNAGLFISLLIVTVTGVLVSNYLFKGIIPLELQRNLTVHQLHVGVAYYLLVFMGVHLGLHIATWWQRLRSWLGLTVLTTRGILLRYCITLAIAALGAYGAVQNQLLDRLALKHIFATAATRGSGTEYFAYLVAMFALFVVIGELLNRIMSSKR